MLMWIDLEAELFEELLRTRSLVAAVCRRADEC
jgi:hypothetical protein